ncbi:hoka [Carabus blaptoides fortunei]
MKFFKSFFYYFTIILLIIAICSEEVEARRKILRGRKTVTRTYFKSLGIPAFAIVLLAGLGMLIMGGVLYAITKSLVLKEPSNAYSPPAMQHEV